MTIRYLWENIHTLLIEGFTDEELRRFCFDSSKFRPVYEQLSQQTGKTQIIQLLLDHADRKNLVEPLLLWAKEQNPAYYEQCQPYFKHIPYWYALIATWEHRVRQWGRQSPTIFNTQLILLPIISLVLLPVILIYLRDYRRPGDWLSPIIPAPGMPDTGFNIAIAQFNPLGESESLDLTEGSQKLSEWLYKGIVDETGRAADLNANFWGPDKVGVIPGANAETRADNAKAFADHYRVNLLIYGVITATHNSYYVQPEFYVSWQGFDYASEVIGPNRLGQPASFNLPLEEAGTLQGLSNELKDRRKVLQHLVAGLGYFYDNDYNNAWAKFTQASLVEQGEGQEVVYMLMGAAKLLVSDSLKANPAENSRTLTEAADAFSQARQLNPNYARSYLGLGAVAFQQATIYNQDGTNVERVDENRLEEAEYWYSQSLNTSDKPKTAYVDVKANFGLGRTHLIGYQFKQPHWSGATARDAFNMVIDVYNHNRTPELAWLVGQTHALLCRLYNLDQEWQEMNTECRQAIDILSDIEPNSTRTWQAVAHYWVWVACAEKKRKNFNEAYQAYNQAIQTGQAYGISAVELTRWQVAREKVEEGASCREF